MTSIKLELAFKRLAAALDQLEAACERRAVADLERGNLEEEFAVMQDDRSKLAVELDGAVSRSATLERANDEVAKKLRNVSVTLQVILERAAALEK